MTDKPSRLKRMWNIVSGKHPLENNDGTVTTRHGRYIVPYKIHVKPNGAIDSNLPDVLAQPRMAELMAQMAPLLKTAPGDKFVLDETTGDFYLKSDIEQNGVAKAKPLGQIDIAAEKDLFILAAEEILNTRAFGPRTAAPPPLHDGLTGKAQPRRLPPPGQPPRKPNGR